MSDTDSQNSNYDSQNSNSDTVGDLPYFGTPTRSNTVPLSQLSNASSVGSNWTPVAPSTQGSMPETPFSVATSHQK